MPNSETIVVDTYAWIEYFRGSEAGKQVKKYIDGNCTLLTPTIVIAELNDKYRRQNKEEDWQARKHFLKFKSDIINLDCKLAEQAGEIKQEMRKKHKDAGLADAIIASHADAEDAKILTGDKHLIGREGTIDISGD